MAADEQIIWRGLRDSLNRPTGRGTLQLSKRARYEGHMVAGQRSGRGVLLVDEGCSSDEDEHGSTPTCASSLRVSWRNDAPCGPGVFTEPDGASVHGQWVDGVLHGPVNERHADGSLRFAGAYRDGQREGFGVEVRADGGALVGGWVSGELHGSRCAFLYPCRRGYALVGEWRRGVMLRAAFAEVRASPNIEHANATKSSAARRVERSCAALPESAEHPSLDYFVRAATAEAASAFGLHDTASGTDQSSIGAVKALCAKLLTRPQPYHSRFSYAGGSEGGEGGATSAPDLALDPFEAGQVEVRASRIAGGGNGLFARRELQASDVAGFLFGRFEPRATGGAAGLQLPPGVPADWALLLGDEWLTPHCARGGRRRSSQLGGHHAGMPLLPGDVPFCATTNVSAGWRVNHGGWRANCAVERFQHPMAGDAACVRVLPGVTIAEGEELLLAYDHLPDLPDAALPDWYRALLSQRDENGYYAHLRHSPPRTVLDIPSAAEARRRVRVVEHGPWRVLWVGRVEQGMTFHGAAHGIAISRVAAGSVATGSVATGSVAAGSADIPNATRSVHSLHPTDSFDPPDAADSVDPPPVVQLDATEGVAAPPLVDLVVGFDYQRTMVASASALAGCFGTPASETRTRPHGLLVGLGGGSCAAALHALGCDVTVLEYDQAVLDAAGNAHGLSFEVRSGAKEGRCKDGVLGEGSSCTTHRRPIVVHLADARVAVRRFSGCFDFALLDAYDGNGDVPTHLQAGCFLADVGRALTAGGFVLANLWNGSDAAKRAGEQFAKDLHASVGRVFALQVEGHEQNIIVLSMKAQGTTAAGPSLEAVRASLRAAAASRAEDGCPDEELFARCMRSCAATISSSVDA
jgi:hypothetical protein